MMSKERVCIADEDETEVFDRVGGDDSGDDGDDGKRRRLIQGEQ